MYKMIFIHIEISGKKPLKFIPMGLESPVIPILMTFFMLLYRFPSSVLPCSLLVS